MNNTSSNPKGAGRKNGTKDGKPRITAADRLRAEMLYITGHGVTYILKDIGISSPNTIYRMIHKGNWDEKRQKYIEEKSQDYLKRTLDERKRVTDETLQDLKTIKEKAMQIIPDVEDSKVKFGEAVSAYNSATDLERKIGSEGVENAIVSVIVKSLRDTIEDPQLLARVGSMIIKNLNEYKNNPALLTSAGQSVEQNK